MTSNVTPLSRAYLIAQKCELKARLSQALDDMTKEERVRLESALLDVLKKLEEA
jgi:hypothetical protein